MAGIRHGGRKKGTPNQKTQVLLDKCEEAGLDVFGSMLAIALETKDPGERFSMLKELAQYLYPKRKAVEHTGRDAAQIETESTLVVEIRDYIKNKLSERD